jgi:putrescine transport system substrate-binding protein
MRNILNKLTLLMILFYSLALHAEEEKVLNIYNWLDYIAPDTISNFEKETGIKVRYDMFDSNEVLENKIMSGKSDYDLVVPSAQFLANQIKANVFQPIDKAKLTNLKNIDPAMLKILQGNDPNNAHGIPYLWGTTGLGFNKNLLVSRLGAAQPLDTWSLIFDPAIVSKLKDCGVTMLNAPDEVLRAALFYKGLDPNSTNIADYEKAAYETMMAVRPYISNFNSSQYIDGLASGEVCLSLGWPGDISIASANAAEAKKNVELVYIIPKEGAGIWFDMMAIPSNAKHPNNALLFMNYIMRPDVIAAISNSVGYPNPNTASLPLIDKSLLNNPNIYPPAAIKSRLYGLKALPPDVSKAMLRVWTKVKTGT